MSPFAQTSPSATPSQTAVADASRRAKPAVAITDLTGYAVQEPVGKRAHLVIVVQTDAGVVGIGEAPAGADPSSAVGRIAARKRELVGRDATAIEAMRRMLSTPGAGPDSTPIQGALNMALLDIAGKLAKAPTYEVLGGPTRSKVRALAWLGDSIDAKQLPNEIARAKAAGFRAVIVPLRLPEGPTRGRGFYRETLADFEALRAAAGDDLDFVLDCGGRLNHGVASALAREFERFHLLWLEEPLGTADREQMARISAETVTPLGCGREVADNAEFLDLLRADAIDALRPDTARHGITSIRKAAALAETYYVGVAPFHRGGPIATAAAIHAAAAMPNFVIQELPSPADEADRKMRRAFVGDALETVREGFLSLPTGPGLGISLNMDAVREYAAK